MLILQLTVRELKWLSANRRQMEGLHQGSVWNKYGLFWMRIMQSFRLYLYSYSSQQQFSWGTLYIKMNIGCNISERASTLSISNGGEKELTFNRKKLARGGEERKQNKTQTPDKIKIKVMQLWHGDTQGVVKGHLIQCQLSFSSRKL